MQLTEVGSRYLVDVNVVCVVHDERGALGEELADHGTVGLAVDVGHGVLQHLVQLGLLHLRRGQQLTLQQLLCCGTQSWVVLQEPHNHQPLQGQAKAQHRPRSNSLQKASTSTQMKSPFSFF